jgi:hypothetical protein
MTFLAANSHQHHGASSNTQEVVGDQDDGVEMETNHALQNPNYADDVGMKPPSWIHSALSSLGGPWAGMVEYPKILP